MSLSRRLPFAAALALTAAGLLAPAGARAAADNPANIPGVPIESGLASGTLGGSVYDAVYRIVVPAGHVLILSLTGDQGTDFDLYLFDATATDIYADPPVGLVAKSTGPTSSESITYPTVPGGTFYIDVSAFSAVVGAYHLVAQVATDKTPPQVSLYLDGGAPATNDAHVTATVVATSGLSGVDAMQLSYDGSTWSDWQPVAPSIDWTVSAGDGPKTLWVRVRDRVGNVSAPVAATIALDTVSPAVIARTPEPGGAARGLRPQISVTFSEPVAPSTWMNSGLILQDPNGLVIYGSYSWDAATNTGTFTPSPTLIAGAQYTVSLGPITDQAGNHLAPIGSWLIQPLIAPVLTLSASSALVLPSGVVLLRGTIDIRPGGSLVLERSVGGGPWEAASVLDPSATGAFSVSQSVSANTQFRAHYLGSAIAVDSTSPVLRVLVRREVSLVGVHAGTRNRAALGTTVRVVAALGPAFPPVPTVLRVYRYDAARGRYVPTATVTGASSSGRVSLTWHPAVRGTYYLRVTTAPSAQFANGISPAYGWTIY